VGHADYLHLIEIDAGPHDLAEVTAAGTGNGEPGVGGTALHIADHGIDEQIGHLATNEIHDGIDGLTIGGGQHTLDESGQVASIDDGFCAQRT